MQNASDCELRFQPIELVQIEIGELGAGVRPHPRGGPWKSLIARFGVCWVFCDAAPRVCDIVLSGVCLNLSVLCPALFLIERVS